MSPNPSDPTFWRENTTPTAEEILDTRKALGLSQTAFAQLLGTSQTRVTDWETGRFRMGKGKIKQFYELKESVDVS